MRPYIINHPRDCRDRRDWIFGMGQAWKKVLDDFMHSPLIKQNNASTYQLVIPTAMLRTNLCVT